ncbi:MAG: hypothetical protein M3478_10875, partial [Planctomycetota bacterium]|nr:hypothetical protein [Planctomycetota bacterium]
MAIAGVVGSDGAAASAQQTQEPTPAELRAQIEALQTQVRRLEANQQNGAQVFAQQTKADVMADAERRSTPAAMTGGYEGGKFTLRAQREVHGRRQLSAGRLAELRTGHRRVKQGRGV